MSEEKNLIGPGRNQVPVNSLLSSGAFNTVEDIRRGLVTEDVLEESLQDDIPFAKSKNKSLASANGDSSLAVGSGSSSSGDNSTAVGDSADAGTVHATAIGYLSSVTGVGSTSIGSGSSSSGDYSMAYGYNAIASGDLSVAVGYLSKASDSGATAVGRGAEAVDEDTVAIGRASKAGHLNSVALGTSSETSGVDRVSIGKSGALRILEFLGNPVNATDAVNKQYADGIVESGHVAVTSIAPMITGGSWIKYADGTMVCHVQVENMDIALDISYQPGTYAMYFGNAEWTFPKEFDSPPVVLNSVFKWGTSASWASSPSNITTTKTDLRGMDIASRTYNANVAIQAMAIGRWK